MRDEGDDLLMVLRRYRDAYRQIGPDITHGLLSELDDLPKDFNEVLPNLVTAILTRAVERGQLDLGKVTPRVAALPGNLVHELMLTRGRASSKVKSFFH